jgi:chromosome segregation ATPase
MTRSLPTLIALCLAVVTQAHAASDAFRSIIGDAANIERDADAISRDWKAKSFDQGKVKTDIESLGNDIASLRKDVDALDSNLENLTPRQKSDWELVKTKVQLLTIFYDRKAELLRGDLAKNRSMIRAHAQGISKRAKALQETANRLDR